MRMFLPFRRQRPRPTQRPSVHLSLENLEGRDLLSVSVIPLTNPSSGAAALSTGSSAQPALPLATQATTNKDSEGAATQIPALFNGQSVTINVLQLSDKAAASIVANNPRLQTIFVTNDLDEPQTFAPVLSAVPGQNFNGLWDQVLIQFNPGVTPHQFTSEADILAAAQAGQITLINTGEVYRDSVVGGNSAAALSTGSSAQSALPLATQATTNKDSEGAATQIPAFFNGQSVTINVLQLSDKAAASIVANTPRLQTIFVTNDLDEPQTFAPVLSAVPGQNFNGLWDQVLIQFNPG